MREHFYKDVPKLGSVALSRHAQLKADQSGITDEDVRRCLFEQTGPDIPDGQEIVWRESNNIRLVIVLSPTPNKGARLVTTIYRIQPQAKI